MSLWGLISDHDGKSNFYRELQLKLLEEKGLLTVRKQVVDLVRAGPFVCWLLAF